MGAKGADHDAADSVRYHHRGKRPGKGLFVDMGVVQFAKPQKRSGLIPDLPPAGEMIPASVGVFQRHLNAPAHPRFRGGGGDDFGWLCEGLCGWKQNRKAEDE